MTNEEKSIKIATDYTNIQLTLPKRIEMCMQMAQWKDEQLKEYLWKKLNEQKDVFGNEQRLYDRYDWVTEGKIAIISEIINELFEEETK